MQSIWTMGFYSALKRQDTLTPTTECGNLEDTAPQEASRHSSTDTVRPHGAEAPGGSGAHRQEGLQSRAAGGTWGAI